MIPNPHADYRNGKLTDDAYRERIHHLGMTLTKIAAGLGFFMFFVLSPFGIVMRHAHYNLLGFLFLFVISGLGAAAFAGIAYGFVYRVILLGDCEQEITQRKESGQAEG